jgi:large subunit ribosomal protein L24
MVMVHSHDVWDEEQGRPVRATGRVLRINSKKNTVLVEGVNVVKRHRRGETRGSGEIVEKEAPIHLSNVMLVGPEGEGTRTGMRVGKDGAKQRFSKRTNEEI